MNFNDLSSHSWLMDNHKKKSIVFKADSLMNHLDKFEQFMKRMSQENNSLTNQTLLLCFTSKSNLSSKHKNLILKFPDISRLFMNVEPLTNLHNEPLTKKTEDWQWNETSVLLRLAKKMQQTKRKWQEIWESRRCSRAGQRWIYREVMSLRAWSSSSEMALYFSFWA